MVLAAAPLARGTQDAPHEDSSSIASPDTSPASADQPHDGAKRAIEQHLAIGRALLEQGDSAAAQAEFRAVLEIDATQPDALRLMTHAQQQGQARRVQASQRAAHLRSQAQDLAVRLAREKAKERTKQETAARSQVARAREQQLKFLYTKGLGLYRQGDFQGAIDTWQQMVLLDPAHLLVREAQRLITRAETKQAEVRARAMAKASPKQGGALVSELEQQLTAKRIEIETVLKYAKISVKGHNYEMATSLLQRILTQDPQHKEAQQLLQQVETAKLKDEEDRLKRRVAQDEQVMANEIIKAQILPDAKQVQLTPPLPTAAQQTMARKLREPINLDFKDVAMSDVLEFIADAANVSIIPSPHLDLKTRRVSLKVTQLPIELALKYLVKNQSLAYRVEDDAILIASQEEFTSAPLETRVFLLRNGLGPFNLETAAVESNTVLAMDPIKDLIDKSIPQPTGSKLVIDQRSGAIIVTNTDDNLRLVEQLLSQLDVTPVQVLIEARFVELTMTELEQLGLESVLTGNAALDKTGASNGTQGEAQVVTSGSGFKFPALARETEGLNLTLQGVLTGTQFESVLHMLGESKKSKTLSAPRVTTLNNQTAVIRVVDEFRYPTRYEVSLIQFDKNGDGDFDDAGETEFANVPQDIQQRDVGILLHVTPSVGRDLKTITLVLAPEVSSFSQFRDLGGGVTVPEFTSSQLTTSVVIENGQTIILGGLMKDTTSSQLTKLPILGDLPLVGGLFRQKEETSTRKNLLIFITARLLAPRGKTI